MYPDDQIVEIFGEQVMYPGLDPVTHKFTDGDFADPLIKPSHIPAATFNLILDNMESLIRAMGLNPNNTDPEQLKKAIQSGFDQLKRIVGEYHSLSFEPSVEQLINWRYLPLDYQIIKIALYQELYDLMYCGDAKNATAYFWYKCDENGTRNLNGQFMRVADSRGLFTRNAGQNAVFKAENNAPYDGGEIGEYKGDAIRNFESNVTSFRPQSMTTNKSTGAFYQSADTVVAGDVAVSTGKDPFQYIKFDPSRVVPVANENRPASISAAVYISY
jgi:hypothetical protein